MSRHIQNAKYFEIMADESADIIIEEQLVICFRCVDDNFEIHEDFIGLHMWCVSRFGCICTI